MPKKTGQSATRDETAKLHERCSRLELELTSLRAERELLQTVLDLIPDSIFAKDKDKKFILSNKKHFRSLGCETLEDILGKSDADFFPEELAREFEAVDEEIIHSKAPLVVREEQGIEPTTGEENYILVSKASLAEEFGGGLAGIARNITQLKLAILAAEKAREEAEKANRTKNEFLSRMSHEVRTPLNGIMGISRLLMYMDSAVNTKEQLQVIYDNAEALHSIISDMLDLTNIEAGNTRVNLRSFSLKSLISESINIIFVDKNDISLRTQTLIAENVPDRLLGDSVKLRQVLINLLSNAKKFTQKGEISIDVSVRERHQNKIRLQFTIDDEGIGVAEKDRQLIFESFRQADNSLSRRYGGSGLGLTICRELVRLMQGEIAVVCPSPRTGSGSRFIFDALFELDTQETISEELQARELENVLQALKAIGKKEKLLLVEDNPVNQQIALAILEKTGLHADVAENGEQALEALRQQAYSLVLMDLQMPVMDGLTATRKIRAGEKHRDIPIVAITAQVMEGDREECLQAGMNDYIPKPIKPEQLYQILYKILCGRTG